MSTRLNFTHAFTPLLAVEAVFGDVPVVLEFTFTGFSFSVSHIHLTCNREIDRNGSESHRGSPPESWLVLDFREFPQEHRVRRPVLRKKRVHSQNRRGLGAVGDCAGPWRRRPRASTIGLLNASRDARACVGSAVSS